MDAHSTTEIAAEIEPVDKLKFKDVKKYKDRLSAAQKATEEKDALVAMKGKLLGLDIVAVAFEFNFLGGSMGAVVGERFVRAANVSMEQGYSASMLLGFWRCSYARSINLFISNG